MQGFIFPLTENWTVYTNYSSYTVPTFNPFEASQPNLKQANIIIKHTIIVHV